MAEFKDASLWMKIAFFFTTCGILHILFAFATGKGAASDEGEEALFIIAYIGTFCAFICIMLLVWFDECKGNKICLIIFVVAAFVGGIAEVIGVALWAGGCGGNNNNNFCGFEYPSMLSAFGALCLILAAIMGILELVGVGAPGGGSK